MISTISDTQRLDAISQLKAWVSHSQTEVALGNPKPWRAQIFHPGTSAVTEYADGANPREAIDGLITRLAGKET